MLGYVHTYTCITIVERTTTTVHINNGTVIPIAGRGLPVPGAERRPATLTAQPLRRHQHERRQTLQVSFYFLDPDNSTGEDNFSKEKPNFVIQVPADGRLPAAEGVRGGAEGARGDFGGGRPGGRRRGAPGDRHAAPHDGAHPGKSVCQSTNWEGGHTIRF